MASSNGTESQSQLEVSSDDSREICTAAENRRYKRVTMERPQMLPLLPPTPQIFASSRDSGSLAGNRFGGVAKTRSKSRVRKSNLPGHVRR